MVSSFFVRCEKRLDGAKVSMYVARHEDEVSR